MTVTAVKPKVQKSPWGNPQASSFRKAHIRQLSFAGATAEVHKEIVDIVVEIFHMAQEQGVLQEGAIQSYEEVAEGAAATFGTRIALGGVEGVGNWGFKEADGFITFMGDIETARTLSDVARELLAARGNHPDIIPETEESWAHTKPGRRDLTTGCRGDDVQFIQTLLGASDQSGVFDEATEAAVRWLQGRKGIPETGVVDNATWRLTYPRNTAFGVGRNDAGFTVRVAQSLIVAYGWEPELPITGRYGIETDKAIRNIQAQRGLRVNGYMRSPEWVILLGPRSEWPGIEAPSGTPDLETNPR